MSGTHHASTTTHQSPPHVKKAASKASRPPPYKNVLAPKITIKGAKAVKKAKEAEEEIQFEDDDDDMATSFLQFCAMCEKQIVVPNSSILYCSESCRRRDASTTSPNNCDFPLFVPYQPPSYYIDQKDPYGYKLPTYVPRLRPTPDTIPEGRIPAKYHDGKADLDPTEWKPSDPNIPLEGKSPTKEWKPKLTHRPSSEAASYLGKFHSRPSTDSLTSPKRSGGGRPTVGHGRTTVSSRSIPTPGLSHTPTASTSSEESLSLAGTPYEFIARPAFSMPETATTAGPTAAIGNKAANDLTYEKKQVGLSLGSAASGSLKKLLGGSATDGM